MFQTMHYGFLCVIPVLIVLIAAFVTKHTLFAMFCGLCSGSLILGGLTGFADSFLNNLYASLTNESLQWLLIMVSLFGILLTLLEKSGAVTDFGYWTGRFIKTKRAALTGSFLLGILVFIDDYLNNLAVSTTMRSITDRHGIPRVQLGYIVNTTAAPVCLLFPISSWAVYFTALMDEQGVTVNGSAAAAYICGLPFVFYAWFALLVCILQFLGVIPKMGFMKKAYQQAGNAVPAEDDTDAHTGARPWNFLVPLAVMIVTALFADVLMGAAAAILAACVLYLAQKKFRPADLLTTCYDGIMSMGFVLLLCVLAFAIQNANTELGLAEYIISVVEPLMQGGFLPAVTFLLCALYAYATGCFWDMAAIIIPIAIPLSNAMGIDPILTSSAVFSGAAFGSNTCLYGDGVIMCSQGSRIEPLDLMRTTLPYAGIAGAAAFIAYLIVGFI